MANMRLTVQRAVSKAFKLVGNLAEDCILHSVTQQEFNFDTMETVQVAEDKIVKCIRFEREVGSESGEKVVRQDAITTINLMFKTEDVPNINECDTLTFRGTRYRVKHPVNDNGFTTEVDCTVEGILEANNG